MRLGCPKRRAWKRAIMPGDLYEHVTILARPRPNHRPETAAAAAWIKDRLTQDGASAESQPFALRPYKQLLTGLAALVLAGASFIFVILDFPWLGLLAGLALLLVLVLEFEFRLAPVSGLVTRAGENVWATFPDDGAARVLIFAAHYDSKTDVLDHVQRARVFKFLPPAALLGLWPPAWLLVFGAAGFLRPFLWASSLAALAYWAVFAWALGGYVFIPVARQSPGAADNAGSAAVLLGLARDLAAGRVEHRGIEVTVLFTGGEEVLCQGAKAYVASRWGGRPPGRPAALVNLEAAGQPGRPYWGEKTGVFLKFHPADPGLVRDLDVATRKVTGGTMTRAGASTDDGLPFLAAGIPAVTIGHDGVPGPSQSGFHTPADGLGRVIPENLEEMLEILKCFIRDQSASVLDVSPQKEHDRSAQEA